MKGDLFRIVAVVVCALIAVEIHARPSYISCADSAECGLDSCCLLGGGRFSIPRCAPLAQTGDYCSPNLQSPRNFSVYYPDDETVELTNIFSIMCPCQPGLTCSSGIARCESLPEAVVFNTL